MFQAEDVTLEGNSKAAAEVRSRDLGGFEIAAPPTVRSRKRTHLATDVVGRSCLMAFMFILGMVVATVIFIIYSLS